MKNDGRPEGLRLLIESDRDLLSARHQVRALALELGFSLTDAVGIVTALSELARNMLTYAGRGEVLVSCNARGDHPGIVITARDDGPGIPDLQKALLDGYSTSGGLGMGLPGIRRLMDDFQIDSDRTRGTTVTVEKWLARG